MNERCQIDSVVCQFHCYGYAILRQNVENIGNFEHWNMPVRPAGIGRKLPHVDGFVFISEYHHSSGEAESGTQCMADIHAVLRTIKCNTRESALS
jgi:hypothetical protein